MTTTLRRTSLVLAAILAFGCSRAATLQGRIDGLRDVVDQAERNGAYRCAPRELAVAQANLDFAETELGQGNVDRAENHFNLAEPNGRAARSTSHLQAVDTVTMANLACGFVWAEHVKTEVGWRIRHYKVEERITDKDMEAFKATFGLEYE